MTQQDDITQRLRDNADLAEAEHGNARVVQLERDAADEIKRLRAELSKLRAPVADETALQAWADRFPEISDMGRLRDAWNEARASAPVAGEVVAWRVTHPRSPKPGWEDATREQPPTLENVKQQDPDLVLELAYAAPQASAEDVRNAALEVARAALMEIADLADVEADQRGVIVNQALTKIAKMTVAPQASALDAEYSRGRADGFDAGHGAALEKAAAALEDHRKVGREWVPGSLWDTLSREAAARIRALKQPQAITDLVTHGISVERIAPADILAGGQQRAGDAVRDALWTLTEHNALHFGEQHSTVIQGRAALSAPQAEQGERDE